METPPKHENLRLQLRLRHGAELVMGPGRADLLTHIAATGSIAAAGRLMGMSYKRAWALVEEMNTHFSPPLVEAVRGGRGGGGARLSPQGQAVLAAYRALEAVSRTAGQRFLAQFQAALQVPPGKK